MPTNTHKLKIEVVGERLVAACACGAWRRCRSLDGSEGVLPVALPLLEYWEEEHARHVARSMDPAELAAA